MLCNYLQNVAAITYIFVLQLSTFLFYNKQFRATLLGSITYISFILQIHTFGVNTDKGGRKL